VAFLSGDIHTSLELPDELTLSLVSRHQIGAAIGRLLEKCYVLSQIAYLVLFLLLCILPAVGIDICYFYFGYLLGLFLGFGSRLLPFKLPPKLESLSFSCISG